VVWRRRFFAPADGSPAPLFTVGPASDRMGLRLFGEPLNWPDRELVSEPVCPGSVQVTRDGQCIILGVDGQTIGGYPKIAQVISADLDRLGQLRPGDRVFFVRVRLKRAEELYCKKRAELNEWVARLRVSLEGLGGS
jgi:antagonist of KipI